MNAALIINIIKLKKTPIIILAPTKTHKSKHLFSHTCNALHVQIYSDSFSPPPAQLLAKIGAFRFLPLFAALL